jgi:hypothetical protein
MVKSRDIGSEGVCHGYKSQLQLLSDFPITTRSEALKEFTDLTDYELLEGDDASSALDQRTKSILVSPAIIYPPHNTARKRNARRPATVRDQNDTTPPKIAHRSSETNTAVKEELLPEEELIRRQDWTCYGWTEVDYLVLKDVHSGAEHVSAVAPRNHGVSIRQIDSETGSITNVMIGWLSIVLDTPLFEDEEEEEEAQDDDNSNNKSKTFDERVADQQKRIHEQYERIVKRRSEGAPDPKSQEASDNGDNSSEERIYPEEVPPKPSRDSLALAKQVVSRVYDFSGKVGNQMALNGQWLLATLQDDFVGRSVAAGTKIFGNVLPTVGRIASFFSKTLDKYWNQDRPDRDNSGDGES